jgi:hypothetical protein
MPTYKSNTQKIVNLVNDKLRSVKDVKKLLAIAAEQLAGDLIIRVHEDGLDAEGSKIGTYSSKEMYVSINYLSDELRVTGQPKKGNKTGKALTGKGKASSNPKFKNGKSRKSRYFGGGYKEFKNEIYGDSDVTLTLTGSLAGDLSFQYDKGSDSYVIGYSEYGSELYKKLEEHFGKVGRIFIASDEEINEAVLGAEEMINILLR